MLKKQYHHPIAQLWVLYSGNELRDVSRLHSDKKKVGRTRTGMKRSLSSLDIP
jgi:hypothetical protein